MSRRILPADRDGPRFRIVRLWRAATSIKAEVIGSEESPSEAIRRTFAEHGRVMAVDRRGDVYTDNHNTIQERP